MEQQDKSYNFHEPQNTACFACSHVLSCESPILEVTHDLSDGAWQFLCGKNVHEIATGRVICLKDAVNIDSSVNELAEMQIGIGARRNSIHDKWEFYELPEERT